jgi:hypothetical protein
MVTSLTFDSNRYCAYCPCTSAESCPERRDAFANGPAESAPLINPPGGRYTIARILEYSTGVTHKYKIAVAPWTRIGQRYEKKDNDNVTNIINLSLISS